MVLGWVKRVTFSVHFVSNPVQLLIWQEVLICGPETGDTCSRAYVDRWILYPIVCSQPGGGGEGADNPLSAAALLLQIAVGGAASLHTVWCLLGTWMPTPSWLQEPLANAILNGGSILRASTRPTPWGTGTAVSHQECSSEGLGVRPLHTPPCE